MIGDRIDLKDIVLQLDQVVPTSEEESTTGDEVEHRPYKYYDVTVSCATCSRRISFCILANPETVSGFFNYFFEDVRPVCLPCVQKGENGQ
ncbi:E7 [Bettongia penicillata papillomavirus 1]|uniref:Protein E7 n=1 Tax=Bettongia penicillata papillomavirus 1 TaxID=759701 RepID=D6N1B9_9PAPI|nr:E7 [Bettongia penicillata papillomavirus 1]ADG21985.1 E7 [Bettongia penicillata papillomavirus 1]